MVSYKEIKKNKEVMEFIKKGSDNLKCFGFTDHSEIHAELVAKRAAYILEEMGCDKEQIEIAKIAGFLHDIGNVVNRRHHAEYGALLANDILKQLDISIENRTIIVSAIGNHDESTGNAYDVISAALIIADKSDVRRDRVTDKVPSTFDVHDRVNYAVTSSKLRVDKEKKTISLNLQVDEKICGMFEYFDIFLGRMIMCRNAAEILGMRFKLLVNGRKIL